jgi:hypothetical protein
MVARHLGVYDAIRFAATCKTIHAGLKEWIEEQFKVELLSKNVAVSLAAGLQQRLKETYGIDNVLVHNTRPTMGWENWEQTASGDVEHEIRIENPDGVAIASLKFKTNARVLEVALNFLIQPWRLSDLYLNLEVTPRTEAEGLAVERRIVELPYANGLMAMLVAEGFV